jgi:hypothetical protein
MSIFPPMDDERRKLLDAQRDQWEEFARLNKVELCAVCGECIGLWRKGDGWWERHCMSNPTHEGFKPEPLDKWTLRTMRERERMRREP